MRRGRQPRLSTLRPMSTVVAVPASRRPTPTGRGLARPRRTGATPICARSVHGRSEPSPRHDRRDPQRESAAGARSAWAPAWRGRRSSRPTVVLDRRSCKRCRPLVTSPLVTRDERRATNLHYAHSDNSRGLLESGA
jgi:hypothetical protein